MDSTALRKLLAGYDDIKVRNFLSYCEKTAEYKKDGQYKNIWFRNLKEENLAHFFKQVALDDFEIDGKHILIVNRYGNIGVEYDYQAYKNKMYKSYPESLIDVQLVKENDIFNITKDSGNINYKHIIGNPFANENIIGGYCVIKNKRGQYLTILSKDDIEKHRKKSKDDTVWREWYEEMCLKTLIKKACSKHFNDIYQNIETLDNENYDLENSTEISVKTKQEIENLTTIKECEQYYNEHSEENEEVLSDFIKTLATRKQQIKEGF